MASGRGVFALVELSIVLITKNQAWNVARLVRSALRVQEQFPSCEIVLVDSASADSTAQVALDFPVCVVKLHDHQQLTPAAGRYVGYKHTTGQYVLFLDGDMELREEWLPKALQVFDDNADVGVVTGRVWDLPINTGPQARPEVPDVEGMVEIKYSGGAALYRREVLDSVGQFNPFLCSDEEPDLCIRIRHAGYRIVKTRQTIVFHYTEPRRSFSTMMARWKRNLYLGFGQNMRYHFGRPTFTTYMRERGYALAPGLVVILIVAAVGAWLIAGKASLLLGLLAVSGGLLLVAAARKRSFSAVLEVLLHRALIFAGTIKGLTMPAPAPETYPVEHDVLAKAPAYQPQK